MDAENDNCVVGPDDNHCEAVCCAERDKPHQPELDYSSLSKKKQGNICRSFQPSWFTSFKWLNYCLTRNKIFCFYCYAATKQQLVTFSKKNSEAFVSVGFDNWKKALEKFREHESSQMHQESQMKLHAIKQTSVAVQLSSQKANEQKNNRKMLCIVLNSLKYLVRQGLAVRGHNDESGNLWQLLECRSADVKGLKSWISKKQYLSHDIIDEQIKIMAVCLLDKILAKIHKAQYFSIIGDETRDISGKEQFAVSIRYVEDDYTVNEDIIALVDVDETDSATLAAELNKTLRKNGLLISNCCGQAYDGASNMSGRLNGVAARIQAIEKKAHYVHCTAHCLNLCLQDCGRNCAVIRDALTVATELATIIHGSPKRLAQFKCLQEEFSKGLPGLKPLCPTRWTVRTGAIHAVISNYPIIFLELEKIGTEASSEGSRKAIGLIAVMEKFATYFGLKLCHLIFAAMEQLSKTLQYKDISAQVMATAVEAAKRFLQRQREPTVFKKFYDLVVEEACKLTSEPTLPRQRRIPQRVNDGAPNHHFLTAEDYFRQQYFEAFDLLLNEITQRFSQPTFLILQEMEKLLINSCHDKIPIISTNFEYLYSNSLDIPKLKVQLSLLTDVLKTGNLEHKMGIKTVTSISTVCQLFETCKFPKIMLGEVHNLLKLYLCIPVSSATAERTFSALRRVKSYLRSTMSQERLNNLILLNTHKDLLDEICIEHIAKDFVSKNDTRRNYFGNF